MSPPESASEERSLDAPPASAALLAIGITVLVLGIVAVVLPVLAALAAEIVLAWLALLVGVLQLVHAYHSRKERGVGRLAAALRTLQPPPGVPALRRMAAALRGSALEPIADRLVDATNTLDSVLRERLAT